MISKIYEELKIVPFTMCLMCLLYIGGAWLYYDHVPSRDIYAWRDQIAGIQFTLRRDHLDSRIHAVETEIFNLKQHVLDEMAKSHPIDPLYNERIEELRQQDEQLKMELSNLPRNAK